MTETVLVRVRRCPVGGIAAVALWGPASGRPAGPGGETLVWVWGSAGGAPARPLVAGVASPSWRRYNRARNRRMGADRARPASVGARAVWWPAAAVGLVLLVALGAVVVPTARPGRQPGGARRRGGDR
jgi:hypothetical protein